MATHAPITGASTRAPFIPAPPAAITRVLSRFDREQLASFIVVAIDLLDLAAGDPDLEDGGDDELTGDEKDASFPEWRPMGKRSRTFAWGMESALNHEDAEDCDPDEDSDPDQCVAGDDGMAPVITRFGQRWGAAEDDADGGDVAWPERMRQPDAMMGGVAGDAHEDAEPWRLPPHWQALLVPANDTVLA